MEIIEILGQLVVAGVLAFEAFHFGEALVKKNLRFYAWSSLFLRDAYRHRTVGQFYAERGYLYENRYPLCTASWITGGLVAFTASMLLPEMSKGLFLSFFALSSFVSAYSLTLYLATYSASYGKHCNEQDFVALSQGIITN